MSHSIVLVHRQCRWQQQGHVSQTSNYQKMITNFAVVMNSCTRTTNFDTGNSCFVGIINISDTILTAWPSKKSLSVKASLCSETSLTGESRFQLSIPPEDLNLRPLWREANRLVHWTSETWWDSCEIAGSPQGSPPAADSVVVKTEGRPAVSVKPGQESCVRSSGTVTLLARGPSDSWGRSPVDDQSRQGHQCSKTSLTGESRFHISIPPEDLNLWPLWREANRLVHWTSETWW
jgi:hypothetical protein